MLDQLPEGVRLVAVSKFHPNEAIEEAYKVGQRIFGESREQELSTKHETLPKDIEWHFIGHLQTNKVKYIAPYIAMIHGWKQLKHVCIAGVMGMGTNTDDEKEVEKEFRSLADFFRSLKQDYFSQTDSFKEISMGMSHDYHIAIKCGTTLVRVGSKIFGERIY